MHLDVVLELNLSDDAGLVRVGLKDAVGVGDGHLASENLVSKWKTAKVTTKFVENDTHRRTGVRTRFERPRTGHGFVFVDRELDFSVRVVTVREDLEANQDFTFVGEDLSLGEEILHRTVHGLLFGSEGSSSGSATELDNTAGGEVEPGLS